LEYNSKLFIYIIYKEFFIMVRISVVDKTDIIKSFIKITIVVFITTVILRYTKSGTLNEKRERVNFISGIQIR